MKAPKPTLHLDTCAISNLAARDKRRHRQARSVFARLVGLDTTRGGLYETFELQTIVLFELEKGLTKSSAGHRRRAMEQFIRSYVHVVEFEANHARAAGALAARNPLHNDICDVQIAGAAIADDATLITEDAKLRTWLGRHGIHITMGWAELGLWLDEVAPH